MKTLNLLDFPIEYKEIRPNTLLIAVIMGETNRLLVE